MALFSTVALLFPLTPTFMVCQLQNVNFLQLSDLKPFYGAKVTVNCPIPALIKFRKVIVCILKKHHKVNLNRQSQLISLKLLKMQCFMWDGVPLNFNLTN
jgi:hypothetical protein